jgi:hypothetical protein
VKRKRKPRTGATTSAWWTPARRAAKAEQMRQVMKGRRVGNRDPAWWAAHPEAKEAYAERARELWRRARANGFDPGQSGGDNGRSR